ncbi:hypothetical protein [Lewinella sp. IMCC34191]|uniref:hypothetical protein n=1 Tax=Lewinella sp. IMCC34191 TaxID=2259172 RepID=UPI000E27DF42|nr:hypothetical protein [Lewinella sp. IMCC34191]
MQLDPNSPFATQINPAMGNDFENIVASCYFYLGYHVQRNLTVLVAGQTAAEIDVLASMITPLFESRIAVECKGSTPSFNELRKFSTVDQILKSDKISVKLAAYGANNIREEHIQFASVLGINLMKKEDLSKKVLPILWNRGTFRLDRIRVINRYLAVFQIKDYYYQNVYRNIANTEVKKDIGKYIRFLKGEVWSVADPVRQLELCFEKAKTDFLGFTDNIAQRLGTTAANQVANPTDETVQLAMLLELEHRILNLYAIARTSILARTESGRKAITERTPAIRNALNKLCDHNVTISQFPNFIFRYFFLWGGTILKHENFQKEEMSALAIECGISIEVAESFMNILKEIYETGNNLFQNYPNKEFFKYVPPAFRSLGAFHRKSVNPEKYNEIQIFFEDAKYENMLNAALVDIGGTAGLKF